MSMAMCGGSGAAAVGINRGPSLSAHEAPVEVIVALQPRAIVLHHKVDRRRGIGLLPEPLHNVGEAVWREKYVGVMHQHRMPALQQCLGVQEAPPHGEGHDAVDVPAVGARG